MKRHWSKKQVQRWGLDEDRNSLMFFSEKLGIMEDKETKSITIDLKQI